MVKSTSFVGVIASDIASCVVKLVADPVAVLFLFASGFLIYSHLYLESGLIKSLVALLLANNATKVIGTWVNSNIDKFLGLSAFIPAILVTSPSRRVIFGVIAMIWVFVVPEGTPLVFVAQAIILLVFMCAKFPQTRVFLVLLILAVYVLGWFHIPGLPKPASRPTRSV